MLSWIIRDDEKKPLPLEHIAGFFLFPRISLMFVVNTLEVLFAYLYLMRVHGVTGFLIYMVLFHLTALVDVLGDRSVGKNLLELRRRGFSDLQTFLTWEGNLVSSQMFAFVIVRFICVDAAVYSLSNFFLSPRWLLHTGVNLVLSEALFTFSHYLLHTWHVLTPLHVMHHCCVHPSWTTNLIFHPLDLALEFSGPVTALIGMHFFVWQDQFSLLVSFVVLQLWYAYDHDNGINLYHVDHHRQINSLYAIYINIKGDPKKNILRDQMLLKK